MILAENEDYRVLELTLNPGEELQNHYHKNRHETWTILAGEAWVKIEETSLTRSAGDIIAIARWSPHILRNNGDEVLRVIEVQQGLQVGGNPDEDWYS